MMNNVMWIYGFGGAKDAYKPISRAMLYSKTLLQNQE